MVVPVFVLVLGFALVCGLVLEVCLVIWVWVVCLGVCVWWCLFVFMLVGFSLYGVV